MNYIVINSRSGLESFLFGDLLEPGFSVIAYPEKPMKLLGKIGRVLETGSETFRFWCYPGPDVISRLQAIKEDDSVLFFAIENSKNLTSLLKYVRAKDVRLFLWNPVATLGKMSSTGRSRIERLKSRVRQVLTFDPEDASRHRLRLVPQPYRAPGGNEPEVVRDFYFAGVDKGRLRQLLSLKNAIAAAGLTAKFHLVGDRGGRYSKVELQHLHSQWLSYTENLSNSRASRCLIEIVQKDQSGPTLRSMEALFLQKKIVTNRRSAVDDPFYDPSRVLVIDAIDPFELFVFMKAPVRPVDPLLVQPHEINSWLRQIFSH